jgi:hypothetical protein
VSGSRDQSGANTEPWVDFGPGNRVYAASLPFDDQTFHESREYRPALRRFYT